MTRRGRASKSVSQKSCVSVSGGGNSHSGALSPECTGNCILVSAGARLGTPAVSPVALLGVIGQPRAAALATRPAYSFTRGRQVAHCAPPRSWQNRRKEQAAEESKMRIKKKLEPLEPKLTRRDPCAFASHKLCRENERRFCEWQKQGRGKK